MARTRPPVPHDSNLGSKLDPHVDSYRDGRSGLGASTQGDALSHDPVSAPGTSTSGGIWKRSGGVGAFDMDPTTTGQLPRGHDATKSDATTTNPEYTSSRDGLVGSSNNNPTTGTDLENKNTDPTANMSENADTSTTGNTAGPHSSHLANKLDPRVDSDQDGSKTVGGEDDAGYEKGEDPNVVERRSRKLTGTAAPGSHSALFGLTPDGHKEQEVDHGSTKPKPAHSKEDSTAASGDGATFTGKSRDVTSSGDTGSRAPEGSGVQEQLNDPRLAQKGDTAGTNIMDDTTTNKPGSGSSETGPSLGSDKTGQDT